MRQDTFVIPEGYDAKVSVISSGYEECKWNLAPARPDLPNNTYGDYTLAGVPA